MKIDSKELEKLQVSEVAELEQSTPAPLQTPTLRQNNAIQFVEAAITIAIAAYFLIGLIGVLAS